MIYHDELAEKVIESDNFDDLKLAHDKIKELEERINDLESRLPKKYEKVKFLNYQVRKRILVTGKVGTTKNSFKFLNLSNFRWRGIRWKSFSRLFNETGKRKFFVIAINFLK